VADLDQAKHAVRGRIWALLEREGAAPVGVYGRIPAFTGAELVADRLVELPIWRDARVVKAVPDRAQQPVRVRALRDGKLLYMAVPKLAGQQPFVLLDPARLTVPPEQAAANKTALEVGEPVSIEDMQSVDLVVCGSVAVSRRGVRLGKGAGYSDIEVALLVEAGLLGEQTTIVTTVHDLQVVDDELPEAAHDFSVDLIVTPTQVISCGPPRRPSGLDWSLLTSAQVKAMPVLRQKR
jgi:5-formyltetrahydrofolate cyclo-ligase